MTAPDPNEPTEAEAIGGLAALLFATGLGCVLFLTPLEFGWAGHLGRVTVYGWAIWGWLLAWVVAFLATVVPVWIRRRSLGNRSAHWSWRATGWVAGLGLACYLVGVFVTVALHGLGLLPATRTYLDDRAAASRLTSNYNLKQLASGANAHADHCGTLPAGCLVDARGVPLHGWPVQLLPYLEHENLYKLVQFDKPWDDPSNRRAFQTQVSPLEVVARSHRDADGYALNFYAANVHVLGGDRPRHLAEFAEQGTSNVLLFGEVGGDLKPWGHPLQWRDPALGLNTAAHGFGTPVGRDSVQFVMLDGSVRAFDGRRTDPEFLRLLQGTPANRTRR